MITQDQKIESREDNGSKNSKTSLWLCLFALSAINFLICRSSFAAAPADEAARHYQQGLSYERLGRINEAYTELQLASNLNPSDPKIQLVLGLVASRVGNLDVAQRALEQSISIDSNSVASYHHLALIYEKKNMRDRALDSWTRFMQLNQDKNLRDVAEKHIKYLEAQ